MVAVASSGFAATVGKAAVAAPSAPSWDILVTDWSLDVTFPFVVVLGAAYVIGVRRLARTRPVMAGGQDDRLPLRPGRRPRRHRVGARRLRPGAVQPPRRPARAAGDGGAAPPGPRARRSRWRSRPAPALRSAGSCASCTARPVQVLTHPLTAWVLFGTSIVTLYFTPLYELSLRNGWFHVATHAYFLLVGCLFLAHVVGLDPIPHALGYGARLLYVLVLLPFHTFVGVALLTMNTVIAAGWYDQVERSWGAQPARRPADRRRDPVGRGGAVRAALHRDRRVPVDERGGAGGSSPRPAPRSRGGCLAGGSLASQELRPATAKGSPAWKSASVSCTRRRS